jgi:hypothetical protein
VRAVVRDRLEDEDEWNAALAEPVTLKAAGRLLVTDSDMIREYAGFRPTQRKRSQIAKLSLV